MVLFGKRDPIRTNLIIIHIDKHGQELNKHRTVTEEENKDEFPGDFANILAIYIAFV